MEKEFLNTDFHVVNKSRLKNKMSMRERQLKTELHVWRGQLHLIGPHPIRGDVGHLSIVSHTKGKESE